MSLNSRILEKTAEIQRLLDEINAELVQDDFKTPTITTTETPTPPKYTTSAELPPVEYTAPVKQELIDAGVDMELLDFLKYGNVLKPKKFLGDLWSPMNDILIALNYVWVRDGKESRWEFQAEGQTKPSPTVTPRPIKTDEIKWLIKDGDKTVEARANDAKAWAFVKKYDAAEKKTTDEVKSEGKELYEFLKSNKEYVDGTYKFTMSKDSVFFNRQKI